MSLPVVQPFVPLPPVNLSCNEAFIAFHDNLRSNRPPNGVILTAVDIPSTRQLAVSTIELYGSLEHRPGINAFCIVDTLLVPRRLSLSFNALYHRRDPSSSEVIGMTPAVPVTDVRLLGRIHLRGCHLEHQHGFYQHNFALDPRVYDVVLVSHIRSQDGDWQRVDLSASVVVRGRMLQSSDL